MSDSDLSDAPAVLVPPDAELKESLRKEVRKAARVGGDVTVRRVREASIQALGLPEDFFTSDKWKAISKEVIHTEYDRIQHEGSKSPKPAEKPKSIVKSIAPASKRPAKQAPSTSTAPPRKKKKPSPSNDESSALSSQPSDMESETEDRPKKSVSKSEPRTANAATRPVKSKPKPKPPKSKLPSSSNEDEEDSELKGTAQADNSDSEMSVVLDDGPPKQQRSKNKDTVASTTHQSKKAKPKPKPGTDDDPEKEEIKKLQGWLVKCGVRKVWGKELKPYETSKAKIKHLRDMLAEVGMTGRFSNEKAAQIKEARELAADIEAVQEGAQRWGKDEESGDSGENKTRGGRRLVRGAMNYDFLSSDGEETD